MNGRDLPDNNHGGYALVEIILSIGILAVVGMYVVELFVLAGATQSKAYDLDAACTVTQNTIEKALGGYVFAGDRYYNGNWNEAPGFSEDGFTMTALLNETYPPTYTVSVFKNGNYVSYTDDRKNAGQPLFSMSVILEPVWDLGVDG